MIANTLFYNGPEEEGKAIFKAFFDIRMLNRSPLYFYVFY